jgi:hypothetical protein
LLGQNENRSSKNGVKFYVVGKEKPILRSRELSEEEKENAKE